MLILEREIEILSNVYTSLSLKLLSLNDAVKYAY